jgi:DNA invertase Pin-like site-specific DNA recombinase
VSRYKRRTNRRDLTDTEASYVRALHETHRLNEQAWLASVRVRDGAMRRLHADGATVASIARALDVSRETVYRVLTPKEGS